MSFHGTFFCLDSTCEGVFGDIPCIANNHTCGNISCFRCETQLTKLAVFASESIGAGAFVGTNCVDTFSAIFAGISRIAFVNVCKLLR